MTKCPHAGIMAAMDTYTADHRTPLPNPPITHLAHGSASACGAALEGGRGFGSDADRRLSLMNFTLAIGLMQDDDLCPTCRIMARAS